MDLDYDKASAGVSDGWGALAMVAILFSAVIHVGLMVNLSDCPFAPLPLPVKNDKRWTKDMPVMQMQKMAEDPMAVNLEAEMPPPAPPEVERQEDRVDRLADAAAQTVVPELPASVAEAAPKADKMPEPAPVAPAEWQPRQEILAVELPTVPDEAATLPRVVIPDVPRVKHAADITPAFDLMSSVDVGGTGAGTSGAPKLSAAGGKGVGLASLAGLAPTPPPVGSVGGAGGSGTANPFGFSGPPPSLTVMSDADEKRAEGKAKKEQEKVAALAPSPPAPAPNARVDEKKVVKEKEAVRVLRDEQVPAGEPFDENVRVGLGAWIDPARPKFKYFRVRVSSRSEKPLPVVSKDMVFMLDASGSIANDRLRSCRKAVSEALRALNTGDRFNVVAFRDKFTYAFPDVAWKEVTEDTLKQADKWLGSLTAHGQTDVFRTLRSVLALPRDPSRPVVALVVTDGEATSGLTRNAEIISRFSELNDGLISVFMYGVKDSANAYLMDMLTRGNRGGWSRHEGLRWSAASGIPALAKKFERPVLSDVSVIFAASSHAETYPKLVTNLCEDEPIDIYGVCPAEQKEIVFQMRGLNGSTVFENLFRIPFASAEKLDEDVRREWATRRIYALIAAYTAHPREDTLRDMRIFAEHYQIPIPYEKEIK
ncbi:MAG: VWA domain-containing protein [Kiritimatiellae bacterium]|nr:VWA domain-containing protein [Kiritimatiellia bacterium]